MIEYIYNEVDKVKKNTRNIPINNYILLGVIIIVTLIVVLYLCSWYKQYNDNKLNTPVISSTLREVGYDNLSTVVNERDVVVMYMCTTNESICRNFEKKFSGYIKENNLTDEIMYLNLGYSSDENNLLEKVYANYKNPSLVKKIYEYPTLVIFSSGKIIDVLSSNKKNEINISQVDEFLSGYEL